VDFVEPASALQCDPAERYGLGPPDRQARAVDRFPVDSNRTGRSHCGSIPSGVTTLVTRKITESVLPKRPLPLPKTDGRIRLLAM